MKLKNINSSFLNIKNNVRVKDVMSTTIFSLDKNEVVINAINLMGKKSLSSIVILDKQKPIGIVSESDLIKKILLINKDPKKTKIIDIMSKDPKKIGPMSSILYASNVMKKLKVRKLVVVDEDGDLLGILSQTDIIESMNKIYESYKTLLWNPSYPFWILIVVLVLYLISFMLKLYLK